MFHKKFLFISLFLFATQSFANTDCVDLSGDYQCSFPTSEGTPTLLNVAITQTINAEQYPVITLRVYDNSGKEEIKEYVANQQNHQDGMVVSCQQESFQLIRPHENKTFLAISVHYLTSDGNMRIDNLTGMLQPNQTTGEAGITIIGDHGGVTCTRN